VRAGKKNMKKEMEIRDRIIMEQFIGIFPNAINDNLCTAFVNIFNMASERSLTMSSTKDTKLSTNFRKDEVIHIPNSFHAGLSNLCFPPDMLKPFWETLSKSFEYYQKQYSIDQSMSSFNFKMHRVHPTGGYHVWHQERHYTASDIALVWMVVLEAPEKGGETEFLHQSMRVEPKVGQLVIWPSGFTHKHRGNPPLEGHKTYITGWFHMLPEEDLAYRSTRNMERN